MRSLFMILFCGVFAISCVSAIALAQEASPAPEMRAAGKMVQDASGARIHGLDGVGQTAGREQEALRPAQGC
jgi:hypothetical protein